MRGEGGICGDGVARGCSADINRNASGRGECCTVGYMVWMGVLLPLELMYVVLIPCMVISFDDGAMEPMCA